MGTVPGWLLRHRITIEPYLGAWGQYGPPVSGVRAALAEKILTSAGQAGVLRVATITAVTRLDVECPDGSLVTLADGRKGYASAVARHDSAGLPRVPDHQEIAIAVAGTSYGAPLGGELVIVLRRVADGVDRYQNVRYRTEEVPVAGAAVRVLGSDEKPDGGGSSVTDSIEVVMPAGTPVAVNDRLRVRGLVYEVDGTPEDQRDPQTGAQPGVKVIARRITG
jgi:hypothetical protein